MGRAIFPGWYVSVPPRIKSCIIGIPGRGHTGFMIGEWYNTLQLEETLIVGITPEGRCWYPMPNGPFDQEEALAGMMGSVQSINQTIVEIQGIYGLKKEQIALVGFSAGAVMAMQVAAHSDEAFAAVVSHGGAILDPTSFPARKHETPFILQHNADDDAFEWEERFLPTKETLSTNQYNLSLILRQNGGHTVRFDDVLLAMKLIQHRLGYPKKYIERRFPSKMATAMSRAIIHYK